MAKNKNRGKNKKTSNKPDAGRAMDAGASSSSATSKTPTVLTGASKHKVQQLPPANKRDSVISSTWEGPKQGLTPMRKPIQPRRWTMRPARWWPCRTFRWMYDFVAALTRIRWDDQQRKDLILSLALFGFILFACYLSLEMFLKAFPFAAAQDLDANCSVVYVTVPGPIITVSLIGASPTNPARGTYYFSVVNGSTQWLNSIAPPSRFSTLVTATPEITPIFSSLQPTSPTLPGAPTVAPTVGASTPGLPTGPPTHGLRTTLITTSLSGATLTTTIVTSLPGNTGPLLSLPTVPSLGLPTPASSGSSAPTPQTQTAWPSPFVSTSIATVSSGLLTTIGTLLAPSLPPPSLSSVYPSLSSGPTGQLSNTGSTDLFSSSFLASAPQVTISDTPSSQSQRTTSNVLITITNSLPGGSVATSTSTSSMIIAIPSTVASSVPGVYTTSTTVIQQTSILPGGSTISSLSTSTTVFGAVSSSLVSSSTPLVTSSVMIIMTSTLPEGTTTLITSMSTTILSGALPAASSLSSTPTVPATLFTLTSLLPGGKTTTLVSTSTMKQSETLPGMSSGGGTPTSPNDPMASSSTVSDGLATTISGSSGISGYPLVSSSILPSASLGLITSSFVLTVTSTALNGLPFTTTLTSLTTFTPPSPVISSSSLPGASTAYASLGTSGSNAVTTSPLDSATRTSTPAISFIPTLILTTITQSISGTLITVTVGSSTMLLISAPTSSTTLASSASVGLTTFLSGVLTMSPSTIAPSNSLPSLSSSLLISSPLAQSSVGLSSLPTTSSGIPTLTNPTLSSSSAMLTGPSSASIPAPSISNPGTALSLLSSSVLFPSAGVSSLASVSSNKSSFPTSIPSSSRSVGNSSFALSTTLTSSSSSAPAVSLSTSRSVSSGVATGSTLPLLPTLSSTLGPNVSTTTVIILSSSTSLGASSPALSSGVASTSPVSFSTLVPAMNVSSISSVLSSAISTSTLMSTNSTVTRAPLSSLNNTSLFQARAMTKVISYGDTAVSFVFPSPEIRTTISYWTGVYPTVTGPMPSDLESIPSTTRLSRQTPLSALPSFDLFSSQPRRFKTVVTTMYDEDEETAAPLAKRQSIPVTVTTFNETLPTGAEPTPVLATGTVAEPDEPDEPGPTSCGESGNFTLSFDDTVVGNDDNPSLVASGMRNPYHHLFYANGFTYVPDSWEPYPSISQPNVAMFLPSNGRLLPSSPFAGTLLPGELGAGPRASVNAYWFNAYSAYFGCALSGLSACTLRISGYRYDAILKQEVLVAEQNATLPACWGYVDCRLTQVFFNEQFRALSGIQFNAYTFALHIPQVHMMDDLEMEWYNNTCSAGILRIGHR